MNLDPGDILSSLSNEIAQKALSAVGAQRIESIFLSGSAARGEISYFASEDCLEVYSDLDLFVVVTEVENPGSVRRELRKIAEAIPREGKGFRVFPRPDVGVFTESDLYSQPPRPGTVEIARAYRLIYGREDIPRRMANVISPRIEDSEALYLLENRLLEAADVLDSLGRGGSAGERRFGHYVTLKNCMDGVSALCIALGRYSGSRGERLEALRDAANRGEPLASLSRDEWAYIEESDSSLASLQRSLKPDDRTFEASRERCEALLLALWKRLAEHARPRSDRNWDALIADRCAEGRYFSNARELLIIAKRLSVPRLRFFPRAASLARLAPVAALRISGLVETLTRRQGPGALREKVGKRYTQPLGRLTEVLGDFEGSVFERARRLYREVN